MGRRFRAGTCLVIALLVGSCTPSPLRQRDQGPLLDSQPVYDDGAPWQGALSTLDGRGQTVPVASLRQLTSSEARFGGWSALTIDPASGMLSAISDRGYWMRAPLAALNGQQALGPDRTPLVMASLRDQAGEVMTDTTLRDAEGLVTLPNGGVLVTFERVHRLWYYPPAQGDQKSPVQNAAQAVNTPPGLEDSPFNGGAETLDLLPDGQLLVIAEAEQGAKETTGWLGTPQGAWGTPPPPLKWQSFRLALSDEMNPTAATVVPGPGGQPYLIIVERSFSLTFGFRGRLSALPLASLGQSQGQPLKAQPLIDLSRPPLNDNWEAIALDPRTPARLWLMTDNNYNSFQRSMLLGLPLEAIIGLIDAP